MLHPPPLNSELALTCCDCQPERPRAELFQFRLILCSLGKGSAPIVAKLNSKVRIPCGVPQLGLCERGRPDPLQKRGGDILDRSAHRRTRCDSRR
jgi:hypothetical protein